jgi:hypothetical protein
MAQVIDDSSYKNPLIFVLSLVEERGVPGENH